MRPVEYHCCATIGTNYPVSYTHLDVYKRQEKTFCLGGWVPCEDVGKLEALLSGFCCAWELTDPAPEEYPDVPVKLKNNKLTWPLNMVTEMYSLPAYDLSLIHI